MNMNRREFSARVVGSGAGLGALGLALTHPARAQGPEPREGTEFTRVNPPVAPAAGTKIEVLEFFSYACPHCSAFEPTLEAWAKQRGIKLRVTKFLMGLRGQVTLLSAPKQRLNSKSPRTGRAHLFDRRHKVGEVG